MSIQVPIRLEVKEGGVIKGYVEALDFLGGAQVNITGPIARITAGSGGGGGDAQTLQGHPASFFAEATEIDALSEAIADRALMWARLGVVVQSSPPASGITYAQWQAGASGFWGWIDLP